jgi:hypothetical protein
MNAPVDVHTCIYKQITLRLVLVRSDLRGHEEAPMQPNIEWIELGFHKATVLVALGLVACLGLTLLPLEIRRALKEGRSLITGRPRQ